MKRALLMLTASLALIGTAQGSTVTAKWSAEATETRSGREYRSVVIYSYAGEISDVRAVWQIDVRCEARAPGAAWTTTVKAKGEAMLAQGAYAGTADSVGRVFVLEAGSDMTGGKARLEIDDDRCASGTPTVRRLLKSSPSVVEQKADPTGRPWNHNGSVVMLDEATGVVAYLEPKASLRPLIIEGTVLFRGALHPDRPVTGTAYAFKAGCAPAPYVVRGTYTDGAATLTLRGAGPIRRGCEVVSYSDRSPHAVLRFTYLLND